MDQQIGSGTYQCGILTFQVYGSAEDNVNPASPSYILASV